MGADRRRVVISKGQERKETLSSKQSVSRMRGFLRGRGLAAQPMRKQTDKPCSIDITNFATLRRVPADKGIDSQLHRIRSTSKATCTKVDFVHVAGLPATAQRVCSSGPSYLRPPNPQPADDPPDHVLVDAARQVRLRERPALQVRPGAVLGAVHVAQRAPHIAAALHAAAHAQLEHAL